MPAYRRSTVMVRADQLDMPGEAGLGPGYLVRIYPAQTVGELIELGRLPMLVGRDETCGVWLDDDSVSRCHARIEPTDEGYTITDLQSTNGLFVNDVAVDSARLAAGDRLRLGNQILKFLSADDVEKQYHEAIYKLATTDGLTQSYNRRYLVETLERELARAARTGGALSVVLLDVDHFKQINDNHGHLAGDEVLQELCRRAWPLLRRDELLARYGGEEFALLLVDCLGAQASVVAERLRHAVAQRPFDTCAGPIDLTISAGVATTAAAPRPTPTELLQQADRRLYAAKSGGRNRVVGD